MAVDSPRQGFPFLNTGQKVPRGVRPALPENLQAYGGGDGLRPVILDLCGGTGAWSLPYAEAGYDVRVVDMEDDGDVRKFDYRDEPVHGILAAPPCTHLAGSGARWWGEKGNAALLDALSIVDACMRIIMVHRPKWWALENPVGRLTRYLGPPRMYFDPWWFGDEWTKKTALWGEFNVPRLKPVIPVEAGKIHRMPPSSKRSKLRSITPQGFARAFFEVNR